LLSSNDCLVSEAFPAGFAGGFAYIQSPSSQEFRLRIMMIRQ